MMEPWTVKYYPSSSAQIQGQNKAIDGLRSYIKNFKKGKAALVYGPPGCGKTSSAHALAKEHEFELIEVNASDARDADSIKEKLGNAAGQMSLFSKSKLILVDEIDGISGNSDRGGLSELSKIIDKTAYPIIMTANDPFDAKFSAMRKKAEMIEFHSLAYPSILAVLKKIASAENIDYDETAMTSLARRAGGDLRGAINDLQTLSEYTKKLTREDIDELSGRAQKETMINALMRIFKTTSPEIALPALDDVDEEMDEVFLWIDENLPKEYKSPEDLAKAYDMLSLADVFRGRISRWQHWRFMSYINNFLTAGIALSKKEKYPGFNKYTRTTRILNIWQHSQKNAKKKSIAQKIAQKTHCSVKSAITDTLPYLKKIYQSDKAKSAGLSGYFEFDKEEIAYLTSPA